MSGLESGTMPHATSPRDAQEEQDDLLIQQALDLDLQNPIDFSRELEPGEKADDAIDFGDLADDDLADDEEESYAQGNTPTRSIDADNSFECGDSFMHHEPSPGFKNENHLNSDGDGFDDLFGDAPSSPIDVEEETREGQLSTTPVNVVMPFEFGNDQSGRYSRMPSLQTRESPVAQSRNLFQSIAFNHDSSAPSKEQQLQQELFAMSGSGTGMMEILPATAENREEMIAKVWPKFERDTVLRFMDLIPMKKARYIGKIPLKRPKPLQPTKLNLELAPDQEKSFRISSTSSRRIRDETGRLGLVKVQQPESDDNDSNDSVDPASDVEHEPVRGLSWQDLLVACEDWETDSMKVSQSSEWYGSSWRREEDRNAFQDMNCDLDESTNRLSTKVRTICGTLACYLLIGMQRQKLNHSAASLLCTTRFSCPLLYDLKRATAKIARKVILDLNDSRLLIDSNHVDSVHRRSSGKQNLKKEERGAYQKGLSQRYNISNDEAYDLLKENHQSKVRSTLGNLTVDHSLPAVRLQWPFVSLYSFLNSYPKMNYAEPAQYKTKLDKIEARSFHKPIIKFMRNEQATFSKSRAIKKKHLKGKDTQSVFGSSKDLSLGDNSSILLLEYSEEYPTMMSNFGMGSRLINYYRRKNMEDNSRPKLDIGETTVLLPQDKSPFSLFGHIDPGQITPAIYNSMYKAPIFKHQAKPSDFLVVRNRTGVEGHTYFMRNIQNLHVVGQEFPSVDVPGPHSRKVTTASKNRLKMISYRLIRHGKTHRVGVDQITKHFIDTTDMQNRQKMKEFMQFSKEYKQWVMRPGETVPEEEVIRAMVKPEDVCLLESMQVGQQHLQDAGFSKGDDDSEEDEGKEGQSIEQQLAPWFTSRNFLNAAQGKAMLQLHGEGDPSGRGEAFSFIKTSMKGGFKAMGESVEDKLDAKKLKELGGHSYNVARQQKQYEDSIRRIWDAQKQSLSSTLEQSDTDNEDDRIDDADDLVIGARTPRSEVQTPGTLRRRDDETTSQFSKFSTASQSGKVLRITRNIRDSHGNLEKVQDTIRDPRVIRQYLKRRHAKEAETTMYPSLLNQNLLN